MNIHILCTHEYELIVSIFMALKLAKEISRNTSISPVLKIQTFFS